MTTALSLPADPAAAGTNAIYGVLQLGAAQVALPLAALREVLPCPPRFSALPASAPRLLGAVSVRGRVVPVLDLRVPLGLPVAGSDSPVVVLLGHDGAVLGLLTDGVRGLTRVPARAMNPMVASGTGLLFSGSFERDEDQRVVSVLDVAAVMALPGVPRMRESQGGAAADAETQAAAQRALMLVRADGVGLAMQVTDIHTTLPRVTLQASSMDGPVCRGVIEHAGARIPAIDPLALLRLGRLARPGDCQALLLRYDAGLVALLVSQVIDIVRASGAELRPLPPLALHRPACFEAMLCLAGRPDHLLLAPQVLQREPELVAFSTLNTRLPVADATAAGGARGAAAGMPVITYDLGAEVASRLSQIGEVLPMPAEPLSPAMAHPAALGLFTHRDRAVTLVCLATLLGARTPPDLGHARVLLVREGEAQFGFVVPRLCHIENTTWEQPDGGPASTAGGRHPLGPHAVVEIGRGAQRRTLHLVDLQALARSLAQTPACGAVPDAARLVGDGLAGAMALARA